MTLCIYKKKGIFHRLVDRTVETGATQNTAININNTTDTTTNNTTDTTINTNKTYSINISKISTVIRA